MDVTIIGHGSLMSGRGLAFSGQLQVRRACIVALAHCRRGFAKLSRYGDRFATDLELVNLPLEGRVCDLASLPNHEVEGLALTVSLDDAKRLSKREGYDPAALQALAEKAQGEGLALAEFLWRVHADAGHDLARYRRALFMTTGFTSPHYIPHPVRLAPDGFALVFLAPGVEGTGSDEVIAVRQQTGVHSIMSTAETWRQKPNPDQLSYFFSCLLGGVHGVGVHDFLATVGEDVALTEVLRSQLNLFAAQEQEQFLAATGLTATQYLGAFGEPDAALKRSGLHDFLHGA